MPILDTSRQSSILSDDLDPNGHLVGAASEADLTKLAALTATAVELNYTSGVTSAIQTQLDGKSATSHAHAAGDVTSGTFADARIAASNVTQHQAALTVTESQISDLGAYLLNLLADANPQLAADLDTNGHYVAIDTARGFIDENGNEQLLFTTVASAVNYLTVGNAVTGTGPTLTAAGSDSDIDLNLLAAGVGQVVIGSDLVLTEKTAATGAAVEGRIYKDSDDDRLKVYANGADRKLNTMTPILICATQLTQDGTVPFGWTVRNGHTLAAFSDALDEVGRCTRVLPDDYQGDGLTVEIEWVAGTPATVSGNVVWSVGIEALEAQDIDSSGFATDVTATTACNATNGVKSTSSIAFTSGAAMDSLLAGEPFRVRVTRPALTNGSDTMVGDAQILTIKVRGTNDT